MILKKQIKELKKSLKLACKDMTIKCEPWTLSIKGELKCVELETEINY